MGWINDYTDTAWIWNGFSTTQAEKPANQGKRAVRARRWQEMEDEQAGTRLAAARGANCMDRTPEHTGRRCIPQASESSLEKALCAFILEKELDRLMNAVYNVPVPKST